MYSPSDKKKTSKEYTVVQGQQRSVISFSELPEFFTSFQLKTNPTDEVTCPLCHIDVLKERIYFHDSTILIVDTKTKKGHKERIMVLTIKHGVQHDRALLEHAIQQLIIVGQRVFNRDFALLSDKFSSVNHHWHIVTTDLNPGTEDYDQILNTPYVLITKKP